MVRLREIAPAVVEHVAAYGDLVEAAVQEYATSARRRVLLVALALGSAVAAVVLAGVWMIMAAWESVYRHWVAGGIVLLLALASYAFLSLASAVAAGAAPELTLLREEMARDRAMLAEFRQGDSHVG